MHSRLKVNIFMIGWFIYAIVFSLVYSLIITLYPINSIALELIITQIGLMFIPFLLYKVFSGRTFSELIPHKFLSPLNMLIIVLLVMVLNPTMMLLNFLSMLFVENAVTDTMNNLLQENIWIGLIGIAVSPAIFEELLFRGMALSETKENNPIAGIILSSLFFGIMHMNLNQFFYAFFLGLVFAYFVLKTKSIFASIFAHFTVNASSFLTSYLSSYTGLEENVELTSEMILETLPYIVILFLFSLPFAAILFRLFNRINQGESIYDNEVVYKKYSVIEKIFYVITFLIIIVIFLFFCVMSMNLSG